MTKTINVSDDIYQLIWQRWVELKNKGNNIKLGRVAEIIIDKGLGIISESDFE